MANTDVYTTKTLQGDILIFKIVKSLKDDKPDTVRAHKPAMICAQQTREGQTTITLAPLALFTKGDSVPLIRSALVYDPVLFDDAEGQAKEILANYNRATSGIITPPKAGLVV